MSGVLGAISNIRTIIIGIAIIVIAVLIWRATTSFQNFGNLSNIFSGITNPVDDTSSQVIDAREQIRDEIDQTEQSIKELDVDLKHQIIDQVDKNRDIILEKEQDTAEQVKRVVEYENAQSEAVINANLEDIETRILTQLRDNETELEQVNRFNRLLDIYSRYLARGSSTSGNPYTTVERWEIEELTDALQAGEVIVDQRGKLVNNL